MALNVTLAVPNIWAMFATFWAMFFTVLFFWRATDDVAHEFFRPLLTGEDWDRTTRKFQTYSACLNRMCYVLADPIAMTIGVVSQRNFGTAFAFASRFL